MMEAPFFVIIGRWGKFRHCTVPLNAVFDGITVGLPQGLAEGLPEGLDGLQEEPEGLGEECEGLPEGPGRRVSVLIISFSDSKVGFY